LQLFFFAALMFAVMLLFLWMAKGYKYVSSAAAADADAVAVPLEPTHSRDPKSALLSGLLAE
jgi:hypothetical protein